MAVSVAVVVGDIADNLVQKIHDRGTTLKVAPWTINTSEMGPVISKEHKKNLVYFFKEYQKELN